MAIYHCRLKVTSQFVRPKGGVGGALTRRSSVAAASYRSGERLWDNVQGKWCEKNPGRLQEVQYSAILAPVGAPAWATDRAQLWNAVERSVLNKDGSTRKPRVNKETGKIENEGAQLYRECELSIPRELWDADRARAIRAVEGFVREEFVADGMIADIGIHDCVAADGQRNVHAHIMLTMRRIETDPERVAGGEFFQSKRERDWDCPEELTRQISLANKVRKRTEDQWKETGKESARLEAERAKAQRDLLEQQRPVHRVRRAWAEAANTALADVQSTARIDHRTLVAQRDEALAQGDLARAAELDREPLPRLSPIAKHIKEARGVILDRQNVYRAGTAARRFWGMAKGLAGTDRGKRAEVFLSITEVMQEMMDDWWGGRDDKARVPVVRMDR